MKILVLGWEYPPVVAGGLGAACHGLTTGLARLGHEILLVVPKGARSGSSGEALSGVAASSLGGARPTSHRDASGIRRIEIDLRPNKGVSADSERGLALSPYVASGSNFESKSESMAGVSARSAAQGQLYGNDLHRALELYSARVVEAVRGLEFDVIHAHDWMTIPAAARLRMSSGKAPLCLHIHSTAFDRAGDGDLRDPIRRVEAAGVRTADRVVAVSDYGRHVILDQYGPEPDRVDVVHNAAPPEGLRVGPPRAEGPPTALFLGRLTRQKGASFFLRAAALVCEGRPSSRFVVAGDGEDRTRLVEESAALGIARNVLFTGSIDDACRDRAYRDASVFVLSSLSEPFGLTPLEALRQGTPVILSDQAGVREVVPSAPHVPPWDRRALAAEIERIFDDPVYAKGLVTSGTKDLTGCDWAASATTLQRTLLGAIRHSRRGMGTR